MLQHLVDLALHLWLPVGLPISVAAGYGFQALLGEVIFPSAAPPGGPPRPPWTATALPLWLGLSAVGALYFGYCRPALTDLFWETRLDPGTGALTSLNARTGERRDDTEAAARSERGRALLLTLSAVQQPLYTALWGWWRSTTSPTPTASSPATLNGPSCSQILCAPNSAPFEPSGVQPQLRLVEAGAHASLFLTLDMLRRAAFLQREAAAAEGMERLDLNEAMRRLEAQVCNHTVTATEPTVKPTVEPTM